MIEKLYEIFCRGLHVSCGRGSAICCVYTSGFDDDVIFSHNDCHVARGVSSDDAGAMLKQRVEICNVFARGATLYRRIRGSKWRCGGEV